MRDEISAANGEFAAESGFGSVKSLGRRVAHGLCRLMRGAGRLRRDEEGAWLIVMSFTLPVLLGLVGLGTEAAMLFYQHRSLQSAADAAAYSAAICSSTGCTASQITTQAQEIVASYGYTIDTLTTAVTNQALVTATSVTYASLPAVQVTISRPETALFASRYLPTLSNTVSATAVLDSSATGDCVLTLGVTTTTTTTGKGKNAVTTTTYSTDTPSAIGEQGSPSISVPGCGVFSNSTDPSSINIGDSAAHLYAGAVGSVGGISTHDSGNIVLENSSGTPTNGTYTQNNAPIANPYANVSFPTTGACLAWSDSNPQPGYYCNNVQIKHVTDNLPAGVYIFGGTLEIGPGGGTLSGTGVTLAFTATSSGMTVDSNGVVTLTAPTTGATAGLVMLGPTSGMASTNSFSTAANASVTMTGTVDVPQGNFNWSGGPATGSSSCLQYIVNTMTFQGNPSMTNSGCSLSSGQVPIGNIVTLVD